MGNKNQYIVFQVQHLKDDAISVKNILNIIITSNSGVTQETVLLKHINSKMILNDS